MGRMDTIKKAVTPKTGLGVGLGTVMGAVFGGVPGALIGGAIGGALAQATPRVIRGGKEEMTPKLTVIYERAMTSISNPEELRKLADSFDKEGFRVQARLLRSRAELRELPDGEKQIRRKAMARAYASDKPDVIDEMAQIHEDIGALNAAKALRLHADAVRAAHAAGKSAKPAASDTIASFAARLVEAVKHFGPQSKEAAMAASNVIRARGKTPDEASVAALISEAVASQAPAGQPAAPGAETGEPTEDETVAEPSSVEAIAQASAASMAAQIKQD